jgi:DNA-directed RNA polymerase specialized sigma24 family protein
MSGHQSGGSSVHVDVPVPVKQRSEDELLCSREPADFGLFYRRHVDWVLGFLARRTRDPELAADLCAEVFAGLRRRAARAPALPARKRRSERVAVPDRG